MQRFVENFPEFRRISGNVTKHVNLMSELNQIVDARKLLDVSPVEQEIACQDKKSSQAKEVTELLERTDVTKLDKVRLVMLFALRYGSVDSKTI